MKRFPLPLGRTVCALRGTLFLAVALVLAQPCTGGPGVFTNTGSLATPRYRHTATLLPNGKVLVAAGQNGNGDLTSAELYDPAIGTWTATNSLGAARAQHTATLLPNGKVLVAGGRGGGSEPASAELYDPASGTWMATASPTAVRNDNMAVLLPNGNVLVAGGSYFDMTNGEIYLASAELYDPVSGTWTATGSLADPRGAYTATLLPNGKVLVAGGQNNGALALSSAELYDPANGTWTVTGSLAIPRNFQAATLLRNGKVLVAGGTSDNISGLASAELYDPGSGTWTATGSLVIARGEQTATLLPSGKVLVAGGRASSSSFLASAELYDPVSGTWIATGGLAVARGDHTVTLLPNGKVLAVGGQNGGGDLASAELYDQGPPFITSLPAASGTVGQPFTYQFTASGATSFGVSNLPPGFTFTPSLSTVTGVPLTTGTFPVGLSASNVAGTTNATLTITVQPAPSGLALVNSTAATGRTGRPFSFQLQTKGGSSATRFAMESLLPPGFNLETSTGFISGTPAVDDSYSLAVSASDGTAITRATLQLTFTSDPTVPIITSARTATLTPGQVFTYIITADASGTFGYIGTDGLVHQGPSNAGLPPDLSFDGINKISGTFIGGPVSGVKTHAADRDNKLPDWIDLTGGIVTNVQLFAVNPPNGTGVLPLIDFLDPSGAVNIATRLSVGTGDNVLIAGFIIQGDAPKRVVIRAIGPSSGVPNALADPVLDLNEGNVLLFSNDNWRDDPVQASQIIETQLQPTDGREAAILAYLNPGLYTAVVRGKNNSMGNAVVQVYDGGTARLTATSNSRLANISTRGTVLTGDNVMIGGFIIKGADTRVVVRAIGPSLSALGVNGTLQDPTLELRNADGVILRANDDWGQGQAAEIQQTGLAPTDPRESALIETLQLGNYTAIVSGKGGATGVAVVEGYVLQ